MSTEESTFEREAIIALKGHIIELSKTTSKIVSAELETPQTITLRIMKGPVAIYIGHCRLLNGLVSVVGSGVHAMLYLGEADFWDNFEVAVLDMINTRRL